MQLGRPEYPCGIGDCEFVAASPGQLGGHRAWHATKTDGRQNWTVRIRNDIRLAVKEAGKELIVGPDLIVEVALEEWLERKGLR